MHARLTRIGIGIIFSLIIAGFILPAVMDVFVRQTSAKHIAKIDGEPINEPHFFRLLALSVQRLQTIYPKLTFQNLVQMNYPTDMLRDFVRRQVMRKHMLQEGFIVHEKTAIDLIKKQMSGVMPESRSERRMLVEDVKTAALVDQLVLPYAFSQDYIKLLTQALSIQRQFNITEIPYRKMQVTQEFTPDVEKVFLVQAMKKYKDQLIEPTQKEFSVMILDPSKISVTMEDTNQYFEQNKAKYKENAQFGDVAKEVENHVRLEKMRDIITDTKSQLESEKSLEDVSKTYGFELIQTMYPSIPTELDAQIYSKIAPSLNRLEEQDYTLLPDDQKEGYFYAIKINKVTPAHTKTGPALTETLKNLWTAEQQHEVAKKLALDVLDRNNAKDDSGRALISAYTTYKNLLISMTTEPSKYPHPDLTPDMVERIMSVRKGQWHMEYGRQGILLFFVEKDVDGKTDAVESQRQAFNNMAMDSAQQAWFNHALSQHKVDINLSGLYQRLG